MTTLPKTNKTKLEEEVSEDPLDTISRHLYPQVDPTPISPEKEEQPVLTEEEQPVLTEEEPSIPTEGNLFTSDLSSVDPPEAKEDKVYFTQDSTQQEPEEMPEQPSVYPYDVLTRPDQRIHQPEYGPDGKLLPGLTKKDLEGRIGEDPLETIARYKADKDYWNQPFIPAIIGIAKEINHWETGIKFSGIVNGTIADTLDWPYDFTMEFMNAALTKTGLDKSVGTFKVNNFRNFFNSIGYTFDEETEGQIEIDEPTLYYIADFVGISIALLPLQTLLALRNAGAVTQSFINESVSKLAKRTWLGKKINLTVLANKIREKIPFLKPLPVSAHRATIKSSFDALKTSLGEIGQTTVQRPFFVSYMETVGSAGAGTGYALGKEYSDSPSIQLLTSLTGAVAFTSHLTMLKMLGGVTIAGIQKLGSTFGPGAERRAASRLASLAGDETLENTDAVLRAILDKEAKVNLTPSEQEQYNIITKYIDPDVLEAMTPAQKSAVVGRDEYLPLEKLITTFDQNLSSNLQAQLKELQEIMLQSFTFPHGTKIKELEYTREIFEVQQEYLTTLATARMKIAEDRAMKKIENASPKLDEVYIATTIRNEVELALDDLAKQEDYLWSIATMDKSVSPASVIEVWKGLLKDRDDTFDPEDLLLTGQNRDVLLRKLGFYDKDRNWVPGEFQMRDIPEGTLVQQGQYVSDITVSIKQLQNIRRRVLKEVREQRKKGNHDKKRIMNEIQKSILDIFKQEADTIRMLKNPETGEFTADIDSQLGHILTAIEHSAMLNRKFNDDIVGELLGPSATAQQKVDPTLTAEFIFSGTPLKQSSRIKKILEAVTRESILADQKKLKKPSLTKTAGMMEDVAILQPVTEALEAFLQHQFIKKWVTTGENGKLVISNPVKAQAWVKERREIFKLLSPKFKNVFREAIIANEAGLLYGPHSKGLPTKHMERINKYLYNKDRSITVLFTQVDPEDVFNWTAGSNLIKQTPVTNTLKIRRVMQNLVGSAQKDTTGRAIKGLQEFVFDWIIQKSYLNNPIKLLGVPNKTFSGAKMSALLEEPKTQIIIDTILTKQQKAKLKVLEVTANMVDSFRISTHLTDKTGAAQTISGDAPGWFLHRVGNVLGAFAGRQLKTGTLQAPTGGAKIGELIADKMQLDWAERYLIHALMDNDSKHLAVLLQKTDTPAKAREFDRYLKAFFAYTISEYNLPFPNIDRFGTIDGEEEEEEPTEIP